MIRHRFGFTLVELLLALAISGVLLAAVSSSVLSHYAIQDRGLRNIDAGRSMLAISQRLRADLSTVCLALRHREQHALASTDSRWDSGVKERFLTPGFQFSNDTIALAGTESSLILGRLQPVPERDQHDTSTPKLLHTSVLWTDQILSSITFPFLRHDGQVGEMRIEDDATSHEALSQQIKEYLSPVRRVTVKLDNAGKVLDTARYPSCIQSLRFRYFDGETWVKSWNSERNLRLPSSVEMSLLTSDGTWHTVLCSVGSSEEPR